MSSKFKSFLKKFVPSSAKTNKHYADTVLSELKSLQARFDEQFEKDRCISEKLDKIDENTKALNEEISIAGAEIKNQICVQNQALNEKLDEQIAAVNQNSTRLGEQIDANSTRLGEQIDANSTKFGEQIDANSAKLGEQIDNGNKALELMIDKGIRDAESSSKMLCEKISAAGEAVKQKLDSEFTSVGKSISALGEAIKGSNHAFSEKIDALNRSSEELKAAIDESDKKLNSRFDALDNSEKALNNKISDNNAKLLEQLELLKRQAVAIDKLMNDRLDCIEKSVSEVNLISTNILDSAVKIKETAEATSNKNDELEKAIAISTEEILKLQAELEQKTLEKLEAVHQKAQDAVRNSAETVYAHVFNNVITKSNWLKDKNFSPGRWAVGYPYLYVMYQTLNITKPKCILDLGLGQTTKMLTQYAAANEDVEHIVLENDPDWIRVFKSKNKVSERTKIVYSDVEFIKYKSDDSVRVYSLFKEAVNGKKFDFISIDGPLGGDMKKYSRIDILNVIPECLADDFVIMMHDMERQMETNTLIELQHLLKQASIKYRCGRYNGKKDTILICSEQPGYLTSL